MDNIPIAGIIEDSIFSDTMRIRWHEYDKPLTTEETANDIVVATRQKHNGMSWSKAGSGALAIITVARINGELENWIATGEVEFKMVG